MYRPHRVRSLLSSLPWLPLLIGCQASDGADEPSTGAAPATASPSTAAQSPAPESPARPAASPGGGDGAASRASTQTAIAPATAAPDAGAAAAPPEAPAGSFASCIGVGATYDDCEVIYVNVTEASPARCIQLAIDNCAEYGRMALDAELPPLWRLASATVRTRAEPCELGVYYPDSITISGASGEITWDESARQPTEIEIDVSLEERSVSGTENSYQVTTREPLSPQRCED